MDFIHEVLKSQYTAPFVMMIISFFTSMSGVSGAFLLLPYQMSVMGLVNPSVSSTNQLYNIVAIPGGFGTLLYYKDLHATGGSTACVKMEVFWI